MNTVPTINDQDLAVADYLKSIGATFELVLAQIDHDRDDWKSDKWLAIINGESWEYYTGIGHRYAPFKALGRPFRDRCELIGGNIGDLCKDTKELRRNPKKNSIHSEKYAKTVPPTQAGVLYSLLLDADCAAGISFNEFCDNLGYDNDSMKAHRIYFACQDTGDRLSKIFNRKQIAKLQELLEDY